MKIKDEFNFSGIVELKQESLKACGLVSLVEL